MGLGILGVVLASGSLNMTTITQAQAQQGWFALMQPLGFLVFVVASFAEAARVPFDLPEAEQELIGGYHTEYSGMKLILYLIAEFLHMITASFLIVILFLGWYFQISSQQEELDAARRKEVTLKQDFSNKQAQVVNLEAYEKQLDDMKEELRQLIGQLPGKTEMPKLILAISQAALASGISNELFQPGPEAMMGFYAEKPIQLRMAGTYHQFGAFISAVASLPRVVILTMHDVSLRPVAKAAGGAKAGTATAGGQLTLEGTVKTYRYLDDEEAAEIQRAADAAKKPANKRAAPAKPAAAGGK
jgi:type IV pilus assembly protein PilO